MVNQRIDALYTKIISDKNKADKNDRMIFQCDQKLRESQCCPTYALTKREHRLKLFYLNDFDDSECVSTPTSSAHSTV